MEGAPLGTIKSLIERAMLFVGNDSGPAHIAAAFGVPGVVIFGASDAVIWGPWQAPLEVVQHPAGIESVAVEDVQAALERMQVRV